MLAVNVKRSETLDWTGLLTTFITDNYSEKESKDSFAQIQAIHMQRQRLTQLFYQTIDAATDVEPIFQSALEYCSLLKALGKRFPFAEAPVSHDSGGISAFFGLSVKPRTKVTALAANFLWFDAFHREKHSRSCSVEFERAAVLFNAASALSFSAIWADRSTDDGLKKAMKLLQRAAGVFAFLEEQKLVVERTSTLDLMPESFTMLNAMMLAQAQICVHEIALLKQNSAAALAKLASGVAQLFTNARAAAERSSDFKKWLADCGYSYVNHFNHQIDYWTAMMHWHEASVQLDAHNYGVELARLRECLSLLEVASRLEMGSEDQKRSSLVKPICVARATLHDRVLQRSRAATKDNENVYFQPLPAAAALPIVESKILVKVTPFEDAPIGADPFSYLIPAAVAEAAAACRQKLHDLINARAQSAGEATATVKQSLASMELPSCIDAVDSSPQNSVPVELSRALAAARAKGGLAHLNERWRSLQDLSTHVNGVVSEVRVTLGRESSEDQTYRDRFGQRWSRSRSDDITVGFVKDLSTVEQYLAQAASANQTIENELRTNEPHLRLLAMDGAAVEARIPRATAAAKLPEVAAVRTTLFELSDLVERREALIGMLQASVGEFSFLPICSQLESAGKNADHIFKDFLATPHVAPTAAPFNAGQIAAMLSELNQSSETGQPLLLVALRERHTAFVAAQRNVESASGAARLAALKDFQQAVDSFNRILSFLDQGVKFHTDVLVQYLTPLSQHVSDFAMARNMEASANLQDLSTKIAAMSVTSQGAVQGYGSLPATQPPSQPAQGAFIYPSAPNGLI